MKKIKQVSRKKFDAVFYINVSSDHCSALPEATSAKGNFLLHIYFYLHNTTSYAVYIMILLIRLMLFLF
jgi:hypothetical protein